MQGNAYGLPSQKNIMRDKGGCLSLMQATSGNMSNNKQRRRKMFLIRGAGLLNVLREAQMCGRSPNWLGGYEGMPPRKIFEKLML